MERRASRSAILHQIHCSLQVKRSGRLCLCTPIDVKNDISCENLSFGRNFGAQITVLLQSENLRIEIYLQSVTQ
jgi:hypothetical protein